LPLNSDGQQLYQYQQNSFVDIGRVVDHHCLEVIVRFVDIGRVVDHHCLDVIVVLCDKVYQLLTHGRRFSPGTLASSTTNTGRHDIAEILLKVALRHQKSKSNQIVEYIFGYF
jgi:ethanolamine utilization protein EutA (predicted chaperonin)